jgi:alkanesulfonate monooxygenase SsuD/methylene tetrahydromethanopterin reductase-like flavin-dependent oxidoreductase (luciferase family)
VRLGTLVTGITYRNVAHLGKIVATLDVLSGGRAICGIGAAWFEREHRAYGWDFPPVPERFALLEDALQLLPVMWGPGAPPFTGAVITAAETLCYPRPLQDHVPILVGGSGERRTLRLVAQYADACNLFGDAATVAHKVEVLQAHCADVGRDPTDVTVTHLSSVAPDSHGLADQVGRYRTLADAGVQTAIVNIADLDGPEPVERFAEVIAAFRP